MNLKHVLLYFSCFVLALTFSSCIEEDAGMDGFFTFEGELVPNEAVLNGTGLPRAAHLEEVTYHLADKTTETRSLGHVRIDFNTCETDWCGALYNDCGTNTDIDYLYQEVETAKTIAFRGTRDQSAVSTWAAPEDKFAFSRDGADVVLACSDCPGSLGGGLDYLGKEVKLRVIR